jgi:hypothetical protein
MPRDETPDLVEDETYQYELKVRYLRHELRLFEIMVTGYRLNPYARSYLYHF